jgi:hypothetical protein
MVPGRDMQPLRNDRTCRFKRQATARTTRTSTDRPWASKQCSPHPPGRLAGAIASTRSTVMLCVVEASNGTSSVAPLPAPSTSPFSSAAAHGSSSSSSSSRAARTQLLLPDDNALYRPEDEICDPLITPARPTALSNPPCIDRFVCKTVSPFEDVRGRAAEARKAPTRKRVVRRRRGSCPNHCRNSRGAASLAVVRLIPKFSSSRLDIYCKYHSAGSQKMVKGTVEVYTLVNTDDSTS